MLTTSLGHELLHVNQTYNLLAIVLYKLVQHKECRGLLKHVLKP